MPWSGGTYTKGNASTGGWAGDESNGIGIESGRHDTQDDDFTTGINSCLNKDGSNSCTGDFNLGGNKPVNLAAGTAAAPAICAGNDTNTGIYSPAADTWAVSTNGTEKVRVDSSGNVGIGTNNPTEKLQVEGIVRIGRQDTGTEGGELQFCRASDNSVYWFIDAYGSATTPTIRILNASGNGAYIASSGNVGIGTSSPTGRLSVSVGDPDDFAAGRDITGANYVVSKLVWDQTTVASANIAVESTSGSYPIRRSTSSIKYKTDVVDLDPEYADKLHQFRPVFFRSTCVSDNPHYTHYGFIAEELAEIEPRFVQYSYKDEDYEDYTYVDDDGIEQTGKRLKADAKAEPEGVSYDRIVTFLTSVVQRQEKRIVDLEAKLQSLEERFAGLESGGA